MASFRLFLGNRAQVVPPPVVELPGGSSTRYRPKRKVHYLPNGMRVLATDSEFERMLNPLPQKSGIDAILPESVKEARSYDDEIRILINKEVQEDEEDILVARWMLMH